MALEPRHIESERRRRTAPSRSTERRQEELRYRSRRVEASFDEDFAPHSSAAYHDMHSDEFYPASSARSSGIRNDRHYRQDPSSSQPMNRRPSQRPRRRKRAWWIPLCCLLLISGIVFGVWRMVHKQFGPKYWTLAIFGVDSRNGNLEKGALSDVIMLASVNNHTGDVKITSVYRDTYLRISPDGDYHKLNEAYFKGGHEQAVQALEENFDLKIDDYATFNWSAVAKGINGLGGVDLDISDKEFAYINAFITETVESTGLGSVQLKHSGMNHLDGVQAVAYGRLRLMDTDFNRTARQRKVLSLAMEKAKQSPKKTLASTALYVLPDISTSMGPNEILDIAGNIKNYNLGEATGFPFARTTKKIGKMDCVIPGTLESNVIQLHTFLYGEDAAGYTPSQTVIEISNHIKKKTGVTKPLDNAPEAKIGGGTNITIAETASPHSTKPKTAVIKPAEAEKESIETKPAEEETHKETKDETKEETKETPKESETSSHNAKDTPKETVEYGPLAPKENGPSAGNDSPVVKPNLPETKSDNSINSPDAPEINAADPDNDMGAGPVAG